MESDFLLQFFFRKSVRLNGLVVAHEILLLSAFAAAPLSSIRQVFFLFPAACLLGGQRPSLSSWSSFPFVATVIQRSSAVALVSLTLLSLLNLCCRGGQWVQRARERLDSYDVRRARDRVPDL